jgi:hypothetical protein
VKKYVLLAALCLLIPAGALAAAVPWSGTGDGGSTVSFKVKKKNGKKFVRAFTWSGVDMSCDQGPRQYQGVRSSMRVRDNGRFLHVVENGLTLREVNGRLGPNGTAEGEIGIQGDAVDQNGNGVTNCSGQANWTATRNP